MKRKLTSARARDGAEVFFFFFFWGGGGGGLPNVASTGTCHRIGCYMCGF